MALGNRPQRGFFLTFRWKAQTLVQVSNFCPQTKDLKKIALSVVCKLTGAPSPFLLEALTPFSSRCKDPMSSPLGSSALGPHLHRQMQTGICQLRTSSQGVGAATGSLLGKYPGYWIQKWQCQIRANLHRLIRLITTVSPGTWKSLNSYATRMLKVRCYETWSVNYHEYH